MWGDFSSILIFFFFIRIFEGTYVPFSNCFQSNFFTTRDANFVTRKWALSASSKALHLDNVTTMSCANWDMVDVVPCKSFEIHICLCTFSTNFPIVSLKASCLPIFALRSWSGIVTNTLSSWSLKQKKKMPYHLVYRYIKFIVFLISYNNNYLKYSFIKHIYYLRKM